MVKHVEKGYKMEAPEGCPPDVYTIMREVGTLKLYKNLASQKKNALVCNPKLTTRKWIIIYEMIWRFPVIIFFIFSNLMVAWAEITILVFKNQHVASISQQLKSKFVELSIKPDFLLFCGLFCRLFKYNLPSDVS